MNIDRIAREMVDVEPSVDLEARIRARVRETRATEGATWWNWRVAVPLAAVASLALAIVVVQGPGSRVQSLPAVAAPAGAVAQAGPGAVTTSQLPNVPTSRLSSVTSLLPKIPTSKLSRASQLSSEEMAWMDRRLPALDPVNSLQVDRLRVDSIQPEPLAITPLTMTPVATESGGIERRNDR